MPIIIDTPRSFRILGKDGAEKYIRVNDRDSAGNIINDLSKGKYDFVVTQGPNIQTQRQEASETLSSMAQSDPELMLTAGDIVYRNLDIPGAAEIAERRRAVLPAPIQALLNKDKPEDPRVVAAMQALQQQEAALQEQGQLVQQAQTEATTDKAAADKAKADVQIALANLKTEQANLATQVAQFQALVANTQAKFATDDAAETEARTTEQTQANDTEREQLVGVLTQELERVQAQSEALAQSQEALVQVVEQLAAQPAAKPVTPKTMTTERVNGGFVTHVVDEATGEEIVAVSERKPGGKMVTRVQPTPTIQ